MTGEGRTKGGEAGVGTSIEEDGMRGAEAGIGIGNVGTGGEIMTAIGIITDTDLRRGPRTECLDVDQGATRGELLTTVISNARGNEVARPTIGSGRMTLGKEATTVGTEEI